MANPTTLSLEHDELFQRVAHILDAAHRRAARSVNTAMVHAYWLIGREIVEVEQRGKERAEYGRQVIEGLAERLRMGPGRGMSVRTLERIRSST
jgi:hypothetical protein